jgi:hypothetical protein
VQLPAQALPTHIIERQSPFTAHTLPGPQVGHAPPPQSTSVSAPFFTWSLHCAATHALALLQIPLAQSLDERHCTHLPDAVQSAPPLSVHAVLLGWSANFGIPATQVSTVQSFLSSGVSLSSSCDMVLPCPSHTSLWQSPLVCAVTAVPDAVYASWQNPPVQAGFWQSVLIAWHWLTSLHAIPPPAAEPVVEVVDVEVLEDVDPLVELDAGVEVPDPPEPPVPTRLEPYTEHAASEAAVAKPGSSQERRIITG